MSDGRLSRKTLLIGALAAFAVWAVWWSSQAWWPVVAAWVEGLLP